MDLCLQDKTAVVTGGSHGIGRAIVLALADEGCKRIAFCGRKPDRVTEVSGLLESKGVSYVSDTIDLMDKDQRNIFVDKINRKFGGADILINNVGGGGRWGKTFEDTPEETWTEVYEKNLLLALRFTQCFVPYMKSKKWGRVITITSVHGRECGGRPWFNIAKFSQTVLMKSLAKDRDLVRSGITFNSVAPGCILIPDTGWHTEVLNNPQIQDTFPLGRLGTPEEVANVVLFLCSGQSSLVNGSSILVDGGESVCI